MTSKIVTFTQTAILIVVMLVYCDYSHMNQIRKQNTVPQTKHNWLNVPLAGGYTYFVEMYTVLPFNNPNSTKFKNTITNPS